MFKLVSTSVIIIR